MGANVDLSVAEKILNSGGLKTAFRTDDVTFYPKSLLVSYFETWEEKGGVLRGTHGSHRMRQVLSTSAESYLHNAAMSLCMF